MPHFIWFTWCPRVEGLAPTVLDSNTRLQHFTNNKTQWQTKTILSSYSCPLEQDFYKWFLTFNLFQLKNSFVLDSMLLCIGGKPSLQMNGESKLAFHQWLASVIVQLIQASIRDMKRQFKVFTIGWPVVWLSLQFCYQFKKCFRRLDVWHAMNASEVMSCFAYEPRIWISLAMSYCVSDCRVKWVSAKQSFAAKSLFQKSIESIIGWLYEHQIW